MKDPYESKTLTFIAYLIAAIPVVLFVGVFWIRAELFREAGYPGWAAFLLVGLLTLLAMGVRYYLIKSRQSR